MKKRNEIIQKIEKLMRSLHDEALKQIPTSTYINTTMGFIPWKKMR